MAGVYDDDIATAKELIAEFGQPCFWLKQRLPGMGVPGYPSEDTLPDPIPCTIVFFSPKDVDKGVQQFLDMMPGTEVAENTQIGFMAGGINFEPDNSDSIARGVITADPIAIMRLDLLAPNGTPVLYSITVAA